MDLSDIMLPEDKIRIESIVKYITCKSKSNLKNELILRNCQINNVLLEQLVQMIDEYDPGNLEILNLSHNTFDDEGCI